MITPNVLPLEGEDGHIGSPINPLGFGRMINIFGDHETDYVGFKVFITDPQFQSRTSGPPAKLTFAPLALGGLPNNCASDICMRNSPVTDAAFTQRTGKPNTIDEIKRIAMSGSQFTYAGGKENIGQFGSKVLQLGPLMEQVEIKTFLTNSAGVVVGEFDHHCFCDYNLLARGGARHSAWAQLDRTSRKPWRRHRWSREGR